MALIRSLRLVLLLGLAALVGGIVLSLSANARLGPRLPRMERPGAAAPTERLVQHASQVDILRTRRGAPTLRVRARESSTYVSGRLKLSGVAFRLYGPDDRETIVEAPDAELLPEPEGAAGRASRAAPRSARTGAGEGIGSWRLRGGVRIMGGGDLILETLTLDYDETDGQARTADPVSFSRGASSGSAKGMVYHVADETVLLQQDVRASMPLGSMGLVTVDAATARHDLRQRTFEMMAYRASTERGETLRGRQLIARFRARGGIERLEGDEGFVLETTHPIALSGSSSPLSKLLALEGTRIMRGRRLAVHFGEESEPVSLEVSGEANLMAGSSDGKEAPSSIEAETLTFDLTNGSLSHARAAGGVDLKGAPPEGQSAGFRLKSEHLDAVWDPNLGSLENLEGQGEIHLSDQDMESHGSRTFLDPDSDIVTLTGEDGRHASATWLGRKIEAQRIEVDRGRKTLSARGGVRASYRPTDSQAAAGAGKGAQNLPFFRGGETIYAMAGSLTFAEQGKVAYYKDQVRLWQEESRVEASEVSLDESSGTLEARGDVISTFRQQPRAPSDAEPPSRSARGPLDDIVTVAAATMTYDRGANRIVFGGRVLITQDSLRVTGDSLNVTVEPGGNAAERMEVVGNVEMKDHGRTGRGDRLIAEAATHTLTLSGVGRESIVQDLTGQQVVRGRSLTMERSGDRILVESEFGGRTWITLKPRQKGVPGLGSDPRN